MSDTVVEVRVKPDRGWAWVAVLVAGVWFTVFCVVFGCIYAASGEARPLEALAVFSAFAVVLTIGFGVPWALLWHCFPGRISYLVTDGELRVLRGRRVIRRHPCSEITFIAVNDRVGWSNVFTRSWAYGKGWTRLYVDRENWPTPRLLVGPRPQPAILLWGDRCAEAERVLREAVVAHGAVLRDEA